MQHITICGVSKRYVQYSGVSDIAGMDPLRGYTVYFGYSRDVSSGRALIFMVFEKKNSIDDITAQWVQC